MACVRFVVVVEKFAAYGRCGAVLRRFFIWSLRFVLAVGITDE